MAEHLASIFGTEKDRVNCPFYFKIGACRHGDRCSRLHNKPSISPTLLLCNMYPRPDMITPGVDAQGNPIDPERIQEDFEDFYEDIFEELSKHGEVESLHVCDNLADHMIGNVYVQFREEEQATRALRALQGRYYSGRPIIAEFSPVTDFREATCRKADREGPAAEAVRAPAPPLPPEPQPEQPQPEPVPPPPELVPLQGPRRRPRVLLPLPQRQWQPPEQREAPQPRQRREPPPARAVEEPEQEPGEGRQRGAEGKDRAMEPRAGGRAGVSRCSGCAGIRIQVWL